MTEWGRTGDDEPRVSGSKADGSLMTEIVGDRRPVPLRLAITSLVRCVVRTLALLSRGEISQPNDRVGQVLRFDDRSGGRVYRETVVQNAAVDAPAVLVVGFRLRWVRGWGHAVFRAESLLNTPLFVGFPGFVSKLWLAHDENGVYRGVYQWSDWKRADGYVRALWWVLAVVSVRGSIRYVVIPGLRRDDVLADPAILEGLAANQELAWWRVIAVEPPPAASGPPRNRSAAQRRRGSVGSPRTRRSGRLARSRGA